MDALRKEIVDALDRVGDDEVNEARFERCAAALLKKLYPNLVPVVGGGDDGFDGAIWTPEGPFPLVTTTGANAIGNFTKNVTTFLVKHPTFPRSAVFATTRKLTTRQQQNIWKRAENLGVTLAGLHEQADFADLLYANHAWRLDLLGIPGHPPALSKRPQRRRPWTSTVFVGRDTDLAWLRDTDGDLLLVGEPGAGKTYLHERLAAAGRCLFAVDFDRGRLADAIRDLQPVAVVVDDAHVRPENLGGVLQLRAELGAKFWVHANCWTQHQSKVQARLGIGPASVRHLDLMPRLELAELVRPLGIAGPDPLVGLILDACDGRPGLADAFVRVCKRDGPNRVWTGEAIANHLLDDDRVIIGSRGRTVLGIIALGGDAGMKVGDVARTLGRTESEVWETLADLSVGGLIADAGGNRLHVRPPLLRPAVLRRTFFGGAGSLPLDGLLDTVPSPGDTALELIAAREREVGVDPRRLAELAVRSNREDVWKKLAAADAVCARLVLYQYPEHVRTAAAGLLFHVASESLPLLLAEDARRGSDLLVIRRVVTDWLSPTHPGEHTPVERRELLLDHLGCLTRNLGIVADGTISWGLTRVVNVEFSQMHTMAVDRNKIQHKFGVLTLDDIADVGRLWPQVLALFAGLPATHQRPLLGAVETWCVPRRLTHGLKDPGPVHDLMKPVGCDVLAQVAGARDASRATRSWAAALSRQEKLGVRVRLDRLFDALFSRPRFGADVERQTRLRRLARLFARRLPHIAARELSAIVREVTAFEEGRGTWDRRVFAYFVAEACREATEWWRAMAAEELPPEIVLPFVDRIAATDSIAHDAALTDLLDRPIYAQVAASCVFALAWPSPELLDRALAVIVRPDKDADFTLAVAGMPVTTVLRLLRHANADVRAMAAAAEWWSQQPPLVRPELFVAWSAAVLEVDAANPMLEAALSAYPSVAVAWCRAHLSAEEHGYELDRVGQGVAAALPALTVEDRRELLQLVADFRYNDIVFDLLVGEDAGLFAGWLHDNPKMKRYPKPLQRRWSPRWERFVFTALDAGCMPADVARCCTPTSWGFGFGEPASQYHDQLGGYQRLLAHPDRRIHPAARAGVAWAEDRIRDVEEHERRRKYDR